MPPRVATCASPSRSSSPCSALGGGPAPAGRLLDVLRRRQVREDPVGRSLGHPGDGPAAVRPALAGAQRRGVAPQDRHVAAARPVAQRQQGEQGRLAAARRAGQGRDGVLVELGVDARAGRASRRWPWGRSSPGPDTVAAEPEPLGDREIGSVLATEHLHRRLRRSSRGPCRPRRPAPRGPARRPRRAARTRG